jgi:hypothetical protein
MLNIGLSRVSTWFASNRHSLDLNKTNVMKYVINNSPHYTSNIGNNEKYCIEESVNMTFLGLPIDDRLN